MTPRQTPEGGWDSLKVDELREELEARGLPKSGKKDELVGRLEEADAAVSEPAGQPAAEEVIPPDEPAEEPTAEEVAEESEEPAEEEVPARAQRGSAEVTTQQRRREAPARPDEAVLVRAKAKYVRSAPRKARLVMHDIRGKNVEQAQAILRHAPRAVSADILKLLNSAVANAESAYELAPDELRVERAFVDEGPTIKRYRPRALGRATRILKRTSHMTIELTTTEGNGR
jgi:large subunit ribosomal protein L22